MSSTPVAARRWPAWPWLAMMAILFLGPLAVPTFLASGSVPLVRLGGFAHELLSTAICPTPARSYWLFDQPMGVCARCWGATIGLWLAWACARRGSALLAPFCALHWLPRLGVAALPFWLWILEIVRFPTAPLGLLLANGMLAGFSAGLWIVSVWPGMLAVRGGAGGTVEGR